MAWEPAPLPELRSARDAASVSALWSEAHPLGPCAGDPVLSPQDAWGIEIDGELVALGAVRSWGRVGTVHGVAVAEGARGRGLGVALLNELVRELDRRNASVIGMEVDAGGAGALTAMARAGFKPMQLSFILEAGVPPPSPDAPSAGETPPSSGETPPSSGEPEVLLLQGAAGAESAAVARGIASSVDSDLDPSAWLAARLARGEAEALVVGPASSPTALAVLPVTGGGDALAVSMLLCPEGPPREALPEAIAALGAHARARGLPRLQIAAPSRYWDAGRALLDMGFRPRASFLRLTRQGYPERADLGRTCLATWR